MSSMNDLSNALKAGTISLSEWHSGMKDAVLSELTNAMILAKNGRDNITQADWGFVGSQVKKQYQFLDKFAAEIQADPKTWLTGNRLNARVGLYNQIGYDALAEDIARESLKSGFTEERRVLGAVKTEHCEASGDRPGCVDIANKGWSPIGSLPPIGDAACWSNCRCSKQYRKPDPANPGEWIIE